MPLRPPPDDVSDFPVRRASLSLRTLYRIFWHRDRLTGEINSPWCFSSLPSEDGRFNLPEPDGTCYWSSHPYGAWLEVFRGIKLVDVADAGRRRLWKASAPFLRLADLQSPRAYAFGVTAAISTQPDYRLPRQWAAALKLVGFDGLVGTCSHDTTSQALNVSVFGHAGTPRSQPGWRTVARRIETDVDLLRDLAAFGVRVAGVPYEVKTVGVIWPGAD